MLIPCLSDEEPEFTYEISSLEIENVFVCSFLIVTLLNGYLIHIQFQFFSFEFVLSYAAKFNMAMGI